MEISVENLSKQYGRKSTFVQALSSVSFKINAGDFIGLVGRNGAGKSSLIKALIGVSAIDEGSVTIDGGKIAHCSGIFKSMLSYLPEEKALHEEFVVSDWVELQAEIKGLSGTIKKEAISVLSAEFELNGIKDKQIKALSKGEGQRVAIVTALMNRPKLLIFDEPFYGLDPFYSNKLRSNLKRLNDIGSAIIVSSHQMPEVEILCKRILMMSNGKIIVDQLLEDLKASHPNLRLDEIFHKLTT